MVNPHNFFYFLKKITNVNILIPAFYSHLYFYVIFITSLIKEGDIKNVLKNCK